MTKGRNVTLSLQGLGVPAAATSYDFSMSQQAVPYTPLPGTDEDDGWEHYRGGEIEWSINGDMFYTSDISLFQRAVNLNPAVSVVMAVNLGSDYLRIVGDAIITSLKINAAVRSLAKMSITMDGSDTPSLENA